MQLMNIYAAYDRKAQYYLPIFQTRSDAEAVRSFTDAVVSSDTNVAKYPADFDLIRLGEIDMETGQITPEWPVGLIINGLVALQAHQADRARYAKAVNPQTDLEDLIAAQS